MTNQFLISTTVVLCSLGGWYVVIQKYLELKAMLKNKKPEAGEPNIGGNAFPLPVVEDFNTADYLTKGLGQHVPGMGPPPLSAEALEIPADILASMQHAAEASKPAAASKAKAPQYVEATENADAKRKACTWAAILHLSAFSLVTGILFANVIVPTIIWLFKKDEHPYVSKQGREVINFQITLTFIQLLFLGLGTIFIWLFPEAANILLSWTRTLRIVFSTSMYIPFNLFTALPFIWACVLMTRGTIAAYYGLAFKFPYAQPFIIEAKSSALNQQFMKAKTPTPAPTPKAPVMNPKINFG